MITTDKGIVEINGAYAEIVADMFLITEQFVEVTKVAQKQDKNLVDYLLKETFNKYPEYITEFTKLFVKATHT